MNHTDCLKKRLVILPLIDKLSHLIDLLWVEHRKEEGKKYVCSLYCQPHCLRPANFGLRHSLNTFRALPTIILYAALEVSRRLCLFTNLQATHMQRRSMTRYVNDTATKSTASGLEPSPIQRLPPAVTQC